MKSCRELAPLCTIPPLPTSSVGAPRHIRKAAATTAIANIPIDQYVLGRASSTARPRTITAVDDRLQFFPVLAADSDLAAGSTASAQDTFYVGNLKGVGRVYQQTFIDTLR
jgi:hypothetical protein